MNLKNLLLLGCSAAGPALGQSQPEMIQEPEYPIYENAGGDDCPGTQGLHDAILPEISATATTYTDDIAVDDSQNFTLGTVFSGYVTDSSLDLVMKAAQSNGVPSCVMNDDFKQKTLDGDAQPEIFQWKSDGTSYMRKIYAGGQDLKSDEADALLKFYSWLTQTGKEIPSGFSAQDGTYVDLKYLLKYVDHKEAHQRLWDLDAFYRDGLEPRLSGGVSQFKDNLVEKGIVYFYRRDKQSRPIMVINIRRMNEAKLETEESLALLDFILGYTQFTGQIPGVTEQTVAIIDFKGVALWQTPVTMLVQVTQRMTQYYLMTGGLMCVINVPWSIQAISHLVMVVLDEFQKEKLLIRGSDFKKDLNTRIGKENLEKKYGGTLDNLKSGNFFPPNLN